MCSKACPKKTELVFWVSHNGYRILAMLSDYHEQTILGQGSFGQVIRVKRAADKKVYCIKRVPLTGLSKRDRVIPFFITY